MKLRQMCLGLFHLRRSPIVFRILNARFSRRKIYCILATIFILGSVFVTYESIYPELDNEESSGPIARFEAGEDALMSTILSWTREWLKFDEDIDSDLPSDLPICVDNSANICHPFNCEHPLGWDISDRIKRDMFDVDTMLTMKYIVRIQVFGDLVPVADVIISTVASTRYFNELLEWLNHTKQTLVPEIEVSLGPNYTTQIVVVNTDLEGDNLTMIKNMCGCLVVPFPHYSFPDHINFGNCSARRPIIVRALLSRVRQSLIYTDPTVMIVEGYAKYLLNRVKSTGVLFSNPIPIAVPVHTANETFSFFQENPCAFYPFPEILSNFGIFRNTLYVSRVLVEPWTACALSQECMCPVPSNMSCMGDPNSSRVGQCHKSDQSVLNILLAKIFRYRIHHVTFNTTDFDLKKQETQVMHTKKKNTEDDHASSTSEPGAVFMKAD